MSKPQSNDLRDYPHVDLLFPSKYLCAADLRGRDVTVTVASISPRDELLRQGGAKEYKPVVRFVGKDKALVLNKTNAKLIARLYGNEVTAWIGKAITLYPTKAQFGREQVDAIRVRPTTPRGQQERTPAPPAPPSSPRACSSCGLDFADPADPNDVRAVGCSTCRRCASCCACQEG